MPLERSQHVVLMHMGKQLPQQRELHAALSCRPAACSSRRSRTEAPPHWPEPQPAHAHDSYALRPFFVRQLRGGGEPRGAPH